MIASTLQEGQEAIPRYTISKEAYLDLKNKFDRIDADGDGNLDHNEVKQAIKIHYPEMDDEYLDTMVKRIFMLMDDNKDG